MSATKLVNPIKKDITFLFDAQFVQKNILVKKAKADKKRIIEGIANFKVIDRIGDLIDPTAFQKSLGTYMQNPQLRFNHEEGSSIGKVLKAEIRDNGLWIQAEIGTWALAEEKYQQMLFGSLKAFSVMGRVIDYVEKVDAKTGLTYYYITEFELIEIAAVEIPMNQLSLFEVKSAKRLTKNRDEYLEVHKQLKDRLLKNYQKRIKTMSEILETKPEEIKDETVKDEVEETSETVETTEETEKSLSSKGSKMEDEDEEDDSTEKAIAEIAVLVKGFVEEANTKFAGFDERLKSLESKGAKKEEEDDKEEDDKEKSLTLGDLKNALSEFSNTFDEKLKNLKSEVKEEKPIVEETSTRKTLANSFGRTVENTKSNTAKEVMDLRDALKEKIGLGDY